MTPQQVPALGDEYRHRRAVVIGGDKLVHCFRRAASALWGTRGQLWLRTQWRRFWPKCTHAAARRRLHLRGSSSLAGDSISTSIAVAVARSTNTAVVARSAGRARPVEAARARYVDTAAHCYAEEPNFERLTMAEDSDSSNHRTRRKT